MKLLKIIQDLTDTVESLKGLVELYLANTNEPLDERWSLYQTLPFFLRNDLYSIQDFLFDSSGSDIELCQVSEYYDRYMTIDVVSFLDDNAEELTKLNIDIIATKEYILRHNLGSFVFDW